VDLDTLDRIRQSLTGIEVLLILGLFSLVVLIGMMASYILDELRGMREENRLYHLQFLEIEQTRNRQGADLYGVLIELVRHMEWREVPEEGGGT
jgi:hypothetical protein